MTPVMRRASGFSLIELMTAITIGLMVLAGLTSVFVNSSRSHQELRKTAEQIENGRYAIELLTQDVRHAGFFGEFWKLPAVPLASDPCTAPTDAAVSDTVNTFVSLPLDLHPAPDFATAPTSPAGCATWLPAANVLAGSDIIVVRRADSNAVTGTVTGNIFYLQTTSDAADVQIGSAGALTTAQNARRAASTLLRRDLTTAATGTPPQFPQVAAAIRKLRTHIYFVAPCSVPANGTSICTGATDDQGKPIPTLKRLEMTGVSGSSLFTIVPLAEGIQAIRMEYGVDNTPAAVDAGTGLLGDGMPDTFSHTRTVADLGNAVAARIYVLARNTESTPGYVDDKTYTLGTATTTAAGDAFKRHVYGTETRITNQAGRREIPR